MQEARSRLEIYHPRSLTAKAPAKWWLEDDPFLLGREPFRGELLNFGGVLRYKSSFAF